MSATHNFEEVARTEHYRSLQGLVPTAGGLIGVAIAAPHEVLDPHPILVAPGFTDGIVGPARLLRAFAEQGRVAITLAHPRVDHPKFKGDPEGHKAENLFYALMAAYDALSLTGEADGSAHSEGGANITRLALEHPELFRTLTLKASGGLIKDDNFLKIYARAALNVRGTGRALRHLVRHPLYDLHLAVSSSAYIAKHPTKALEEAIYIAAADIRPRIPQLQKQGIAVGAQQYPRDELFPLELVARSTDYGELFDRFTVFPDAHAGHLTPQHHPRRVGGLVLSGVSSMAAGYNREYAGTSRG